MARLFELIEDDDVLFEGKDKINDNFAKLMNVPSGSGTVDVRTECIGDIDPEEYNEGAIIISLCDGKIYRKFNGLWVSHVDAGDLVGEINPGIIGDHIIDENKLAIDLKTIRVVPNKPALPDPLFPHDSIILVTGEGGVLYRNNDDVWVNLILAGITDGALEKTKFAADIIPPVMVDALPVLPAAEFPPGSMVVFEGKLYRNDDDVWVSGVRAADIDGEIDEAQLSSDVRTKLNASAEIEGLDAERMEIWDRAEAITETGKFLTEYLEGDITKDQLSEALGAEIDLISDTRLTLALDPDDPDQFSSIKQNAEGINFTVRKLTNYALGLGEDEVLALDENTDLMLNQSPVGDQLLTMQLFSEIDQTAEKLSLTVARLGLSPDDPQQWASIKLTADMIKSTVARLNDPNHPDQFTALTQTADQLSLMAGLIGDPDDPANGSSLYSMIRLTAEEIALTHVRKGEIVSAINLSEEGLYLKGEVIKLDGNVTIDGSFAMDGVYVADGTLDADKIVANSITAGHIAAGAIGADQIAANAIRAKHLMVGDFTNLLPNGDFEDVDDVTGKPVNWELTNTGSSSPVLTASTVDAWQGTYCLRVADNAPRSSSMRARSTRRVPVKPEGKYRFQLYGRTGGTGSVVSVRVRALFFDSFNTQVGTAQLHELDTLTEDWEVREGMLTVPLGAVELEFQLEFQGGAGASSTRSYFFDNIRLDSMATATLIEPGQITTDHIQANSITAGMIQAGAIGVDHLAANTITTDKLAVGSTVDLITNGRFDNTKNILNDISGTPPGRLDGWSVTLGSLASGSVNPRSAAAPYFASITRGTTGELSLQLNAMFRKQIAPGDQLRVRCFARPTGAAGANPNIRFRARYRGASGNNLTPASTVAVAMGNGWVEYSELLPEAPAGTVDVTVDVVLSGGVSGKNVDISEFTAKAAFKGELVVDGTLTSKHIATDSIEARHLIADSIKAGHIDSESIVARHIGSDVIAANHIQGGSINARHLSVGLNNLVANPSYSRTLSEVDLRPRNWRVNSGSTYFTRSTSLPRSGMYCGRFTDYASRSASTSWYSLPVGASTSDPEVMVPASADERYSFHVWARISQTGSPNRIRARIWFRNDQGTAVSSPAGSWVTPTSTYQKVSATAVAPAGTSFLFFGFELEKDTGKSNSLHYHFSDALGWRVADGTFIDSNSITTDHIVSNAITTKHLTTGTLDLTGTGRTTAKLRVLDGTTERLVLGNIEGKAGVPSGVKYGLWGVLGTGIFIQGAPRFIEPITVNLTSLPVVATASATLKAARDSTSSNAPKWWDVPTPGTGVSNIHVIYENKLPYPNDDLPEASTRARFRFTGTFNYNTIVLYPVALPSGSKYFLQFSNTSFPDNFEASKESPSLGQYRTRVVKVTGWWGGSNYSDISPAGYAAGVALRISGSYELTTNWIDFSGISWSGLIGTRSFSVNLPIPGSMTVGVWQV